MALRPRRAAVLRAVIADGMRPTLQSVALGLTGAEALSRRRAARLA